MTQVSNLQTHDYAFRYSTPTGVWRWTTRLDVSQSVPTFTILNVISPYGLLRDSIPIPGSVIKEMAASIEKLSMSFPPHILMGPPSNLTFLVDEGRGFYPAQTVQVTNDGAYGSLLSPTLTTSASYVQVTPAQLSGLGFNDSGTFDVAVSSTSLLAANSPYNETITVQDSNATNTPVVFNVTITVRPKATIALSLSSIVFTVVKPISGPFPSIPSQNFNVRNNGPIASNLDFTVQKLTGLSPWLTGIVPSSGSVVGGQSTPVTVTVAPDAALSTGTYSETLRISGYSSNSYQDIQIQLVVT